MVRGVLGHTTRRADFTGHRTDFQIERVHDDLDLRKLIPHNRGDRKTVCTGKDLIDHQDLRMKRSAELDALATVLGDADALHVRFRIDQVAEVLANRGMVLGYEHTDLCHAEHYRRGQSLGKVPFGYV